MPLFLRDSSHRDPFDDSLTGLEDGPYFPKAIKIRKYLGANLGYSEPPIQDPFSFVSDITMKPSATVKFLLEQSRIPSIGHLPKVEIPAKSHRNKTKLEQVRSLESLPSGRQPFFLPVSPQKKPKLQKIKRKNQNEKNTSQNSHFFEQNHEFFGFQKERRSQTDRSVSLSEDILPFESKEVPKESPKEEKGYRVSIEVLEEEKLRLKSKIKKQNSALNKLIEMQMQRIGRKKPKGTPNVGATRMKNKEEIERLQRQLEATFVPGNDYLSKKAESIEKEITIYKEKINGIKAEMSELKTRIFMMKHEIRKKELRNFERLNQREVSEEETLKLEQTSKKKSKRKHEKSFEGQGEEVFIEEDILEVNTEEIHEKMSSRGSSGDEYQELLHKRTRLVRKWTDLKLGLKAEKIREKLEKIHLRIAPILQIEEELLKKEKLEEKILKKEKIIEESGKELRLLLSRFSGPVKEMIKEAFDSVASRLNDRKKEENTRENQMQCGKPQKDEPESHEIRGYFGFRNLRAVQLKSQEKIEEFQVETPDISELVNGGRSRPTAIRFDTENPTEILRGSSEKEEEEEPNQEMILE